MQLKHQSDGMHWLQDEQENDQSPYEDNQSFPKYQTTQTPAQQIPAISQPTYRTSITELISEPIQQNPYSMQNVYQSLYQLSDYLWNKKLSTKYSEQGISNSLDQTLDENSFNQYLIPIRDELSKYDKFRKSKAKEEEKFYSLINGEHKAQTRKGQGHQNGLALSVNSNHALETELIKCYQQVPFIFFEENFSLNFSNFYDKEDRSKYNHTQKMKEEQEKMNDDLDLIEINLFGQIHRKFEDYFKAAANFDYLKDSITIQLIKLKEARGRMSKVQVEFVKKSQLLRKKIIERNNYEKLIKKMKIMKSLRKLPSIIETILQSSLPYECLELLRTTKKSIVQVNDIKCVSKILSNIKSSQTIVQLGLNKRYTDQLYLYIEEAFSSINFQEQFNKLSADCPLIDDKEQSTLNNISRRSDNPMTESSFRANDRSGFFVLDELGEGKGNNYGGKSLMKNVFAKRLQAKEYQIAMILLQSYDYVDFPVDVTKIKISNGLRVICRKFQKDLVAHIKCQLSKSFHSEANSMLNELSYEAQNTIQRNNSIGSAQKPQKDQQREDSPDKVRQYIDKVSVEFYTRHIKVLNELFKQSINRYLGYILTLVTQYEEKLHKEITQIEKTEKNTMSLKNSSNSIENLSEKQLKSQSDLDDLTLSKIRSLQKSEKMSKMQTTHMKFKQIFSEELSVLPSIFKIIEEKIKHFLTLKNMSNATPQQFFQWVSLIRYWQKWFDTLIEESVLLNYNCTYLNSNTEISSSTQLFVLGQDMVGELISTVLENTKKSISAMNLKNLITQLTVSYLNSYASIINAELHQAILDESWQSVEIPQEFSQVLNSILNKPTQNHNLSITILNSSSNHMSTSFTKNTQQDHQQNLSSFGSRFKFKILKNNILVEGQRYKLTISFLLLCEFIEELIRVGRLFEGITGECDEQANKQSKYIKFILSHLYQKIYELIDSYNSSTKEMILEKKALKMQKIKGNNIAVKHICLLSNCLTFLEKLTQQIPQKQLSLILTKKQQQGETLHALANHNILLIDKISSILNKKMEQLVIAFKTKQQQKSFSIFSLHQFVVQSNQGIVTLFLQITEIIDEYLDVDKCEKILKGPFQLFVHKYFKFIILKGDKFAEEARILLEKMKFLKKYFKNEFVIMQREVEE